MDTGYPGFIPEPYKHPTKTPKPCKPGKSRANSNGELLEDRQLDEECHALRSPNSSPLSKCFLLKKRSRLDRTND